MGLWDTIKRATAPRPAGPQPRVTADDEKVVVIRNSQPAEQVRWDEVTKIVGGQVADVYMTAFVDLYHGDWVLRIWDEIAGVNDVLQAMYEKFPQIDRGWVDRTNGKKGAYQETLFERP